MREHIKFGKQLKLGLACLLGAELNEYGSTFTFTRGGHQLRMQVYGYPEGERRLGFRIICGLDRAEKHDADAYQKAPRPQVDGLPPLLVRRETAKDRKGKRWKLNREVQTGDANFDNRFYVESSAPEEPLQVVLGSSETRCMVETMFEQHCEAIEINRQAGLLVAEFRVHEQNEDSLPQLAEELKGLIDLVLSLKASLPLFVGDTRLFRRYRRVAWGYYTELLLFALGIVLFIFSDEPLADEPLSFIARAALVAVVLLVPLAWLIARGHPHGLSHFKWLLGLGLFTVPLTVGMFVMSTNSLLDLSPPQAHSVVTLADPAYCSHDKHWVTVQDWRDETKTFNVGLHNLNFCSITKKGDILVLIVGRGLWGWPYLINVQRPR